MSNKTFVQKVATFIKISHAHGFLPVYHGTKEA